MLELNGICQVVRMAANATKDNADNKKKVEKNIASELVKAGCPKWSSSEIVESLMEQPEQKRGEYLSGIVSISSQLNEHEKDRYFYFLRDMSRSHLEQMCERCNASTIKNATFLYDNGANELTWTWDLLELAKEFEKLSEFERDKCFSQIGKTATELKENTNKVNKKTELKFYFNAMKKARSLKAFCENADAENVKSAVKISYYLSSYGRVSYDLLWAKTNAHNALTDDNIRHILRFELDRNSGNYLYALEELKNEDIIFFIERLPQFTRLINKFNPNGWSNSGNIDSFVRAVVETGKYEQFADPKLVELLVELGAREVDEYHSKGEELRYYVSSIRNYNKMRESDPAILPLEETLLNVDFVKEMLDRKDSKEYIHELARSTGYSIGGSEEVVPLKALIKQIKSPDSYWDLLLKRLGLGK